jgi:hypothetical protein
MNTPTLPISATANDRIRRREINAHVFAGVGACYIRRADGTSFRISRARIRRGVLEGCIVNGGDPFNWERIPSSAIVELS